MLVEIDIDDDMGDKIAAANLKSLLECLEDDYELRKEGKSIAIFDADKDKDLKIIKKHIKSFKTVLKYYGEI